MHVLHSRYETPLEKQTLLDGILVYLCISYTCSMTRWKTVRKLKFNCLVNVPYDLVNGSGDVVHIFGAHCGRE